MKFKTILSTIILLIYSFSSQANYYGIIKGNFKTSDDNTSTLINVTEGLKDEQFSSSTYYSSSVMAKHAFDNDDNTRWESKARDITNQWILIDFENSIKMESFDYLNTTTGTYTIGRTVKDFRIEGSDNGIDWITYKDDVIPNVLQVIHTYSIDNVPDSGHRYWRFYMENNYGNIYAIVANEINFYGYKK